MSAPPTPCRVVLVTTDDGPAPAIVTHVNVDGSLNVVAFSDRWPLTAARVFRNVVSADQRNGGGPTWIWPPRTAEPPAPAEMSRELELEQRALVKSIAALAERVDGLDRVDALRDELEGMRLRVAELERLAAGFVGEMP